MCNNKENSERLYYIDYLKAISLCAIILAHVNAPLILSQLRSFDVILMVICSGILASRSNRKVFDGFAAYFISRCKRLLIPTYIFLCVYFIFSAIVGEKQNVLVILDTFLLQKTGIGYTWIIMIYLICAAGLPVIKKIPPLPTAYIAWIVLLFVQEIICYFKLFEFSHYVESIVYYIIPYLFVFWLGYWYFELKESSKIMMLLACISTLILYGHIAYAKGEILLVSQYKYPPRLPYVLYGILISGILIDLLKRIKTSKEYWLITFLSKWSLWIYLWHIIPVKISERMLAAEELWMLRFFFVVVITGIIMFVHCKIVEVIQEKYGDKNRLIRYLRG